MLRGMNNKKLRSVFVAGVLAAVVTISGAQASAPAPAQAGINLTGIHGFDFLVGQDQWSIWWLDSRYPSRPLDPPARGRFENGVGSFYASFEQDGKRIIGRLQWSAMTKTSARWEQASSEDDGKTWQPNWTMEMQRVE